MRPLRLFFSLLFSLVFVTFLLYLSISSDADEYTDPDSSGNHSRRLRSYFFFHNPASLFTPAATISLTDDNSTFFAARPAAFGPQLPTKGISGQLWVGSGFGDDNLKRRGLLAGIEGELGCGDIPGWSDHNWRLVDTYSEPSSNGEERGRDETQRTSPDHILQSPGSSGTSNPLHTTKESPEYDDGTDDHFHFPLASTIVSRHSEGPSSAGWVAHADIKTLQESAEIEGKIAILSRGGCGFSEKVKWAQRRGATAVIIGDNVLGGALVRMYAQGDAGNITIPSLFTSHMSAHLLSSLIPKGRDKDTSASAALWKWVSIPAQESSRTNNDVGTASIGDEHGHTKASQQISKTSGQARSKDGFEMAFDDDDKSVTKDTLKPGWIRSSLSAVGLSKGGSTTFDPKDSRRPPSSGQLKWSQDVHRTDESFDMTQDRSSSRQRTDGFIIGIQDWRDPDVAQVPDNAADVPFISDTSVSVSSATSKHQNNAPQGGSITPGSGEYEKTRSSDTLPRKVAESERERDDVKVVDSKHSLVASHDEGDGASVAESTQNSDRPIARNTRGKSRTGIPQWVDEHAHTSLGGTSERHGLWVTLTPTDMSASPFFNTLFVLVISPLITLAIVYSMLLLRSRIRRRRWRAPKSVVERLPVHVYHQLSRSSTSSAPDITGPVPSNATTPLLSTSRPTDITARPRSQTVDAASPSLASSSRYGSMEQSAEQEKEKINAGLAEWKRKYKGKQMECVVCLEEYVDGVSRVMSLPCGHEFHVGCITPWLTTRRRTCPICKGDVVRSAGRPLSSGRIEAANGLTEDEVQEQAAESANTNPSSAMPISEDERNSEVDIEQSMHPTAGSETGTSWIARRFTRSLGHPRRPISHNLSRPSSDDQS